MAGVKFRSAREAAQRLSSALELPLDRVLDVLQPGGLLARMRLFDVRSGYDLEDVTRAANKRIYGRLEQAFSAYASFCRAS